MIPGCDIGLKNNTESPEGYGYEESGKLSYICGWCGKAIVPGDKFAYLKAFGYSHRSCMDEWDTWDWLDAAAIDIETAL